MALRHAGCPSARRSRRPSPTSDQSRTSAPTRNTVSTGSYQPAPEVASKNATTSRSSACSGGSPSPDTAITGANRSTAPAMPAAPVCRARLAQRWVLSMLECPAEEGRCQPSVGALAQASLRAQRQADRVDAVALVGGGAVALALEDVPEVAPAVGAPHLDPLHPHRDVLDVLDRVAGEGGVERRPAAVAVELGARGEQLGATGPAGVDALGLGVGVLADERSLGAGLAQHLVLRRAELGAPLLVGLRHGIRAVGLLHAHASTPSGTVTVLSRPYGLTTISTQSGPFWSHLLTAGDRTARIGSRHGGQSNRAGSPRGS